MAEADVHGKIRKAIQFSDFIECCLGRFDFCTVAGYGPDGIARQLRMPSCLRDCRQNGWCRALFRDLIWAACGCAARRYCTWHHGRATRRL